MSARVTIASPNWCETITRAIKTASLWLLCVGCSPTANLQPKSEPTRARSTLSDTPASTPSAPISTVPPHWSVVQEASASPFGGTIHDTIEALIDALSNIPYSEGDTKAIALTSQPLSLQILDARHFAIGRYGINQSISVISFRANVIIRNANTELPRVEMQVMCSNARQCEAEVSDGQLVTMRKRYSVFIRVTASFTTVTLQDQTGSFATWKTDGSDSNRTRTGSGPYDGSTN